MGKKSSSDSLRENQFNLGRLFTKVNHDINQGQDYNNILDFLFDSLGAVIPFDRIGIALVEGEAESRQICARWVKSKIPVTHLKIGYCSHLSESSLLKILETGQPRIINDLAEYSQNHPASKSTVLIVQDGIKSSLTCPLRANNKLVGVVFFSSAQTQTYKEEHVQTYLEIADQLSLIIEFGSLRSKFSNELLKTQSFQMLVHDLKSPLGVILGFLDVTKNMDWYQELDPRSKEIFSAFQRNSTYMLDLVNEVTELIQLDSGPASLELKEVSLRAFIPELAIRGREIADKKEISFAIITDPLPETARFDRTKIIRVFDNLVTNAVKFSSRRKKLEVVVRCNGKHLIFEVADQGQGIPKDELPLLFQEFKKTSIRPTEGEESTGLGLAIVKKIVEQHGGEISVESHLGWGSTFTFWIPVGS